jgi:hypothetical protein
MMTDQKSSLHAALLPCRARMRLASLQQCAALTGGEVKHIGGLDGQIQGLSALPGFSAIMVSLG